LIPTFSPQGDGNCQYQTIRLFGSYAVDPYLFPARGRKRRSRQRCNHRDTCLVDPYLFPARGRKLHHPESAAPLELSLIPTFSPQGDGN